MREIFVSVEIAGIAVVVEQEEGSRLGTTGVPGWTFAMSVVPMFVVELVKAKVEVVV
jgi:hypothetical protein